MKEVKQSILATLKMITIVSVVIVAPKEAHTNNLNENLQNHEKNNVEN